MSPPQPSRSTLQNLILFVAWAYSSAWEFAGNLLGTLYWLCWGDEEDNYLLGPTGHRQSPSYSEAYGYDYYDFDNSRSARAWRARNTTTRRGPVNGRHLPFSGWVDRVMAMENREDLQEEEEEEEDDYSHSHTGYHQPKTNMCVGSIKEIKNYLADASPHSNSYGAAHHNLLYHAYSHAGLLYHLHAAIVEKLMAKPTKMLPIPRLFVEQYPEPEAGGAEPKTLPPRSYFYCRSGRFSSWEKEFTGPLLTFIEKTYTQGFHHGNGVDLLGELVAVLRFLSYSLSEIPDLVLDILRTARQNGLPISEYKNRERLFDAKWIQSTMYNANPDYSKYTDDSLPMPKPMETHFECEDQPYDRPIGRVLGYSKSNKITQRQKGTGSDYACKFAAWDVPILWGAIPMTSKVVDGKRVNTADEHLKTLTSDFQKILGEKPFRSDVKNTWIAHCFWSQLHK